MSKLFVDHMNEFNLTLLTTQELNAYRHNQPLSLGKHIARLSKYTRFGNQRPFLVASAVFSCQIEGNPLSLEDYYCFRAMSNGQSGPIQEIDNLLRAYEYARLNPITQHGLLTAHHDLLANRPYGGIYRDREATVQNLHTGEIVYRGASPHLIDQEVGKLLADITRLTQHPLSPTEVFYFAAQIHLYLAKIHPFADGNGRMARLLEKWFLSQVLGEVGWSIQSERTYHRRQASYYRHLNLGRDYEAFMTGDCLPFLMLLPWSLREKPGRVQDWQ